jgi:hypothetical protein
LDASDWHLPLVWHLSRLTRNLVGLYIGAPSACHLHGSSETDADLVQLRFTDCTACRIRRELSGHQRKAPGGESDPC